jgi:hypothetical protein
MEMSNKMLTDTDRRIEQIYRAGLESIKILYHFHLPKCEQPGCVRKVSAKDDKRGHKLCEICYKTDQKIKREKNTFIAKVSDKNPSAINTF